MNSPLRAWTTPFAPQVTQAPHIPGLKTRFISPQEVSNDDAAVNLVVVAEPNFDRSADALKRVFIAHRSTLLGILRDHGNILFRGFDVDADQFDEIVNAGFETDRFLWMFPMAPKWSRRMLALPVIGKMIRSLLGWIEATATGREIVGENQSTLANDQTIQFPHHEYGIFFNVPRVLAFFCHQDAEKEGETIICDAHAGFEAMHEDLRLHFQDTKHIRYRSENQWYLPPFTAPAVLHHPMDGQPSMNFTAYQHDVFGQIASQRFPQHTICTEDLDATFSFEPVFFMNDGEKNTLNETQVADLAHAHLDHSVLLRWKKNDVLLMDNFRVVHGRLNAGLPSKKTLKIILCDYVRNTNRFTW